MELTEEIEKKIPGYDDMFNDDEIYVVVYNHIPFASFSGEFWCYRWLLAMDIDLAAEGIEIYCFPSHEEWIDWNNVPNRKEEN